MSILELPEAISIFGHCGKRTALRYAMPFRIGARLLIRADDNSQVFGERIDA